MSLLVFSFWFQMQALGLYFPAKNVIADSCKTIFIFHCCGRTQIIMMNLAEPYLGFGKVGA